MILYVFVTGVIGLIYLCLIRPLEHWKGKGIAYVKSYIDVGSYLSSLFKQQSSFIYVNDIYKSYPDNQVVGVFQLTRPSLMIRDPEIVRNITVKDFQHFTDHFPTLFGTGLDPLLDRNIAALKGSKWHDMRMTLSPAFSSSKMRILFDTINECGKQLTKHFTHQINQSADHILDVELRDVFTRFTNDVIATTAFGLKVDSYENPNNDFYLLGREAVNSSKWRILLANFIPRIMKLLNIKLLVGDMNYFRNLIQETISVREKNNIVRPDMIHLLIQAKRAALENELTVNEPTDQNFGVTDDFYGMKNGGKFTQLTNADIAAQAFLFFIAGYSTVSNLMCFAIYELAVNPEIQKRVYAEIMETLKTYNGHLTYDALYKMKYLDQVIFETLRKWPPLAFCSRLCTKDYQFEADGKIITVQKSSKIIIPIFGIHRDSKYHPKPDVFDPERFSEENKGNLRPFTYIPFGAGPRTCIAFRFALMEAKIAVINMIKQFEVVVTKNTALAKLTNSRNLTPHNGFQFGLRLRDQ